MMEGAIPIIRSYQCGECFHRFDLTLAADQWDAPPPSCPACDAREAQQEFKPVAIGGSARAKAEKIAEDTIANDYGVGNIHRDRHEGSTPKTEYKPPGRSHQESTWGIAHSALTAAMSAGRQNRLAHGNGLDVLHHNLKTGAEVDLIELSKQRSMRVF